ncbi:MAG: ABC transporter ATP-binding protein, partial [Lachnospiraceae bacterium]|nr:ABC transporter ATP-binding protein [Lachnospiraceae bacterium]
LANLIGTAKVCAYFYHIASKEKPRYLGLVLANILLLSILPILNLLIPKRIIEELTGGQDITLLCLLVGLLVGGIFVLKSLISILQELRETWEDALARRIDLSMSEKAMRLKFECTESEAALSARQKAETGMSWYSGGIKGMSESLVRIGTSFCVIFGVIWIISRISPILLLLSVLAVIVNALCTSKINLATQEVFEKTPAINKFYSYIYTKINGREYAKELRLYHASPLIEQKAMENAKALNKMDNECARKQFSWGILGSITSAVGYGISYGWLGVLALKGAITVAEFVTCIAAMETLTNGCLIPLITNAQQLMMKANFMSAYIGYMFFPDEAASGKDVPSEESFDGITLEHVSFKYPGTEQWVLRDVNLQIRKGESISLVGLNGSGKSTLIKLICRLYDVTEGAIKLCGKNIQEYSYEEYVKLLSVVFQDFKLFGYTIEENVRLGGVQHETKKVSAQTADLGKVYEMSGIADWVESLEKKGQTLLGKEYDESGVEPSGGQAQKLAIARAIYRNSPVVILDEPTAALDPVAEYEIYNRFHDLIGNKTAIYVSHRLSSCKFCDKIVVLDDHTIKEIGTHDELLARGGLYANLFQTQAKWYVAGIS